MFTLSHLNGSDLKMASTGMEGGGSDEDKYLMRSCLNNSNGLEWIIEIMVMNNWKGPDLISLHRNSQDLCIIFKNSPHISIFLFQGNGNIFWGVATQTKMSVGEYMTSFKGIKQDQREGWKKVEKWNSSDSGMTLPAPPPCKVRAKSRNYFFWTYLQIGVKPQEAVELFAHPCSFTS